jgi:uncharacterized protein (TIGR02284 family)
MNSINEHCIKVCNSLLRGELSAVETYNRAIEKHPDSPVVDELRRIRAEHTRAANLLSESVREMGGEPEKDSGAWGMITNAIQGTANLFGPESAVESLQKGEEIGRHDYEEALRDDDVMGTCKTMIREELLPQTVSHIASLERLEQVA